MLFSVIIPVYNSEKYIIECVDSIKKQTFLDFELILINDGSTDKSLDVIKKLSEEDERMIIVNQKNKGVSSSRNAGLRIAKGDYIIFMDSDDLIDSDYLSYAQSELLKSNYDLIIFNYQTRKFAEEVSKGEHIKENQLLDFKSIKENIYYYVDNGLATPIWNKIYKRSLIENYSLKFDESLNISEDALFNYKFLNHSKNIFLSKEAFYIYHIRFEESLTTKFKVNQFHMLMKTNNYLFEYGKDNSNLLKIASKIRIKNIYSTVANVFKEDSTLITKKDRLNFVKGIVNTEQDKKNIKWYNIPNLTTYFLYIPIKVKSIRLILFISFILYKIKLKAMR